MEKPDVIGAIFGQTEGLLGSELDLRELQRTGRIGRIEVNIKSIEGNSEGEIIIPSSLDAAETSLLAATLETIERIGPCTAEIKLLSVEDTRIAKRQYAVEKAKDILKQLQESTGPETSEISEQLKESVRSDEITTYNGLPCGPGVLESDEVIIVEGRADVLLLLRYGIRNAIAIEGTSVPKPIADLTKEKIVTVFVDGDRGGELIVKELLQVADIDYIARAPDGKEVEELAKKEVYKALREKISVEQFKRGDTGIRRLERPVFEKSYNNEGNSFRPQAVQTRARDFSREISKGPKESVREFKEFPREYSRERESPREHREYGFRRSLFGRRKEKQERPSLKPKQKTFFKEVLDGLIGTRAACIFNEKGEILGRVPVSELVPTLRMTENPYAVVFDGSVDMRLNMIAKAKGVKFLIGMEKENIVSPVSILAKKDLE